MFAQLEPAVKLQGLITPPRAYRVRFYVPEEKIAHSTAHSTASSPREGCLFNHDSCWRRIVFQPLRSVGSIRRMQMLRSVFKLSLGSGWD